MFFYIENNFFKNINNKIIKEEIEIVPIGNMFLSFFITSILEFTSFYKVFKEDNRYNVIHVEDRSLWFCKVFVKF